jgi:hypothetical protein
MNGPIAEFIEAACVPLGQGHASRTLEEAERLLREHPNGATANIHTAAILCDDAGVRESHGATP